MAGLAKKIVLPEKMAQRFAAELDALAPPGGRLGIAVSGGGDSLALLLLAVAARPGAIAAATVDHRLRADSASDAAMVAALCARLEVPHFTLAADWPEPPVANLQASARLERYRLLGQWAGEQQLAALATAHHADDQAETVLLRLARGSGVGGLGGVRPSRPLCPAVVLVRPLLGWRRAELAAVCSAAGIEPLDDPANQDPRHDRTHARRLLGSAEWLAPLRLAASASHLRDAEDALQWSVERLGAERLMRDGDEITVNAQGLPSELARRLLLAGFAALGAERPRGPELARAMAALALGKTLTLGGIRLAGGTAWRLRRAPPRQ